MNASATETLTSTLVLGAEAQDSLSRLFLNTSVMNASATEILTSTLVLGAEAQDSLSHLFLNTSELFERTLDRLPDVASKVYPSHSCHEWLVSA